MPVPSFQTFDDAWNEFIQTGHFSLNNSTLSLNELFQLHGYVKSCSEPLYIYLRDIRLVSQLAVNSDMSSNVLTRVINKLEQTLLNLLNHNLWQVIQLNKIEVIENLGLSDHFYHRFLCFSHYNELKKLNLYLPNAGLEQYFIQFLKTNPELEILRLDLDYAPKGFLEELTPSITNSKIKLLDLGHTPLDLDAYHALDLLLDNNYYLRLKIPNVAHEKEELREDDELDEDDELHEEGEFDEDQEIHENEELLHDAYIQLVQRAAKENHERFKEEQLTQRKLLIIAENILRQKKELTDFLRLCSNLPMTADRIEFGGISNFIPQVYKKHPIYINQNHHAFRLDWLMPLEFDHQKTAAHHLINVAIAMKDGKTIIDILEEVKAQDEEGFATLLRAGEENSALAIITKFDTKNNKPPSWLKPVKSYVEQHLDCLMPRFETLSSHKALYTLLREFRDHLTNYLLTMDERSEWPAFFKFITGIESHLTERKDEWDHAFKTLAKAVDAGTNPEQPLVSERIRELRHYILPLAYRSNNTKKGWANTSKLNDGNYRFVRSVDRVAEDLRIQLTIQEDPEKAAMQAEINALKAKLREKDEIIKAKDAHIESLENGASPGCSKNILHPKPFTFYGGNSDLEQRPSPKKPTPSYVGIFSSVKPPFESDSESVPSGTSHGISISIPSGWGD